MATTPPRNPPLEPQTPPPPRAPRKWSVSRQRHQDTAYMPPDLQTYPHAARPSSPGLDIPQQDVRHKLLRRPVRLPTPYADLQYRPELDQDSHDDGAVFEHGYKPAEKSGAAALERDLRLETLGIEEPEWKADLPPRHPGRAGRWKKRTLGELGRSYRPLRMGIHGTRPEKGERKEKDMWNRDSIWFRALYRDVWFKTQNFVGRYFGYGDVEGEEVWREVLGREEGRGLLKAVARVSGKGGEGDGGWEEVLGGRAHREGVVLGVIARVLQDGCWDRLLFGAPEEVERLLETQDKMHIRAEGYERTELRAQNIRALLAVQDDPTLPENFWPAVDELTIRLLSMLLPLLDVMDKHFEASRVTTLIEINQYLHSLVAEAGYLALAIRCSPHSIFRFTWPDIGDPWDMSQEHDEEYDELFQKSKKAVEAQQASGDFPVHAPTIAKVKIVLWPKLEMFTRSQMAQKGTFLELIMKSQVCYYCGFWGGKEEMQEMVPTLAMYITEVELRNSRIKRVLAHLRVWAWRYFGCFATLLIFVIVGLALLEDDGEEGIRSLTTPVVYKIRVAFEGVLNFVWGRPVDLDTDLPWVEEDGRRSRPYRVTLPVER